MFAAPAPVEEYISPSPAVSAAPAPVEYIAPAPAVYAAQAPGGYFSPPPAVLRVGGLQGSVPGQSSISRRGDALLLPSGWRRVEDAYGRVYYWHVHTRHTQFTPPGSDDEDEDEEDEEEDEDLDELDDTHVPAHADVPVVPLRELPAGVGVYVRSLCERAAPRSSWIRAVTSFYGPLYLAATCSILFLPEEYRVGLFWVISSGIVSVCYTPWFDIGYMRCASLRGFVEEFLALRVFLGDDFRIVSVFCAQLGSTADTCSASVYVAF